MLSGLVDGPAQTQARLAEAVGRDKTRLIPILDALEARGLVTRAPDPADRRNNPSSPSPLPAARSGRPWRVPSAWPRRSCSARSTPPSAGRSGGCSGASTRTPDRPSPDGHAGVTASPRAEGFPRGGERLIAALRCGGGAAPAGRRPRHRTRQVYDQIRAAIADGRLRPGRGRAVDPRAGGAARRVAQHRALAYDRLPAEGFLRRGSARAPSSARTPLPRCRGRQRLRRCAAALWDGLDGGPDMSAIPPSSTSGGHPGRAPLPLRGLAAPGREQLRSAAVGPARTSARPARCPRCGRIARHVGVSRGVRADAEDVARHQWQPAGGRPGGPGADRAGRRRRGRGPRLPAAARRVHRARRARRAGCRSTPRAWCRRAARRRPAGLRDAVAPVPARHGDVAARRRALLDWAERATPHRRGRLRQRVPLRRAGRWSRCTAGPSGRVLYVGSFSKVLLPTLRLGFVVAPPPLHDALRKAKYVTDWHTPVPVQAAAARFIEHGHLARHIRRMRGVYTARHLVMLRELSGPLPPIWSRFRPRPGCTSQRCCARAATTRTSRCGPRAARGRALPLSGSAWRAPHGAGLLSATGRSRSTTSPRVSGGSRVPGVMRG